MRVKKVPLQDLELWPDEVICFSAYTDTRNPVQQRRTYVDGSALKAENAKLRELCADTWSYINAPVDHRNCLKERLAIYDDLANRMRELGIEVDG